MQFSSYRLGSQFVARSRFGRLKLSVTKSVKGWVYHFIPGETVADRAQIDSRKGRRRSLKISRTTARPRSWKLWFEVIETVPRVSEGY